MGKNPNIIFRDLYRHQKKRMDKISSVSDAVKDRIDSLSEKDKCLYIPYKDVIKAFMIEGYPENKAAKHITTWIDNDLITDRYIEGYHLIGLHEEVM